MAAPRLSTTAKWSCAARLPALLLALLLVLGGVAPATPARAAGIIYVKPGGTGDGSSWATARDLAPALAAAVSGDELWVAAGSYRPTNSVDFTASFTLKAGVAIYGGFAGTETLRSQRNWNTRVATLTGDIGVVGNDSDNSYHVVVGANGATLDGVTITAGNADGIESYRFGGGIYNVSSSPTLANLTISGNNAKYGGGVYNESSSPTLTNVTISGNRVGGVGENLGGGGMYNFGGNPTLDGVIISGNSAQYGGGMANYSSNPTLTNVTISGNSADRSGGGLFNSLSSPTLTNVTISGNSAQEGGGVRNNNSSPRLANVVVSGNSALIWGSGLYNDASSPRLTNVTISGNNAPLESGTIYNTIGSLPTLRNSIVWGNVSRAIVGNTTIISDSLIEGGYPGYHVLNADPQFVAPIDATSAPTTTGDLRLRSTSPAINQGDNTVTNPALPATDRDGSPRITGGRVDLGAYEWRRPPGIVYVKPGGTGNGISWASAAELAPALADAVSGDELWVAAGSYRPTTINKDQRMASFTLKAGVAIYGGFAGTETLRSQRNWNTRVARLTGDIGIVGSTSDNSYHVVVGADNATLDGVSITGGNANGLEMDGGGMFNSNSSPTLTNVTISGNSARSYGGGMYNNSSSSPTLTNVTISGNSADQGGGVYNNTGSNPTLTNVTISGNRARYVGGIANDNNSSPTLTNVTISGNSATMGGGIANGNNSSPTLINVIISGNSASYNGGGLYNVEDSSPTLTNVTISGNSANNGGGIYNLDSSPRLTNAIISGNSATQYGGGMFSSLSSPTLANVTISGNSANVGGGLANDDSTPTLRNSIVWGNSNGAVVSDTAVISDSLIEGGYPGYHILDADPQFVAPIAATSAPTTTGSLHLLPSSPAINQGNNVINPPLLATDRDGNPRIIGGRVDLGAYEVVPAVDTIIRAHPSPTAAATVAFTVTFVMPVSGVDASDFAVTTTAGQAGATISSVTGSGTTWRVVVTTMAAAGTIRLDLVDNDSIHTSDTPPVALGGAGAGNGSYTGGEAYTITGPAIPTTKKFYFPLVAYAGGMPDLVVEAVRTADGQLTLVIANRGNGPVSQTFWVDLVIAPDRPPAAPNDTWNMVGTRGMSWGITTPLGVGEQLTLTVGDSFYHSEASDWGGNIAAGTPLYAHVDSANTLTTYGGVQETHEASGGTYNNVLAVTADSTIAAPAATVAATGAAPLPSRP